MHFSFVKFNFKFKIFQMENGETGLHGQPVVSLVEADLKQGLGTVITQHQILEVLLALVLLLINKVVQHYLVLLVCTNLL